MQQNCDVWYLPHEGPFSGFTVRPSPRETVDRSFYNIMIMSTQGD